MIMVALGESHHSMVVTSITDTDILISEHTNSACNKSLIEIAKSNKDQKFLFINYI